MRESEYPSAESILVGIGASAGGLDALKQLFAHMPDDTGLAFVVVVHLSPDHPSLLADLLQPHTAMPVLQVTAHTPVEPNHVYVIPPGRNLSTIDSHLRLSDIEEQRRERAPIDHFFQTLAETHHERSIGVILSGTGADGSVGIVKIKGEGGLTIVQDPNEAQFDGMPQSAIATRLIDLILPLAEMPSQMLRFARTRPKVPVVDDLDQVPEDDRETLQNLFSEVRTRTGQDFSKYKRSTVLRRIRRRMQLRQKEYLSDYLAFVQGEPSEAYLLAEELLITVTQFFRDAETYEYLEKNVIPRLFEGKTSADRIRVWSVGCATGEEAYSIAMLLLEQAARVAEPPELEVFASDLHEGSLQRAREGFYPAGIECDVPSERLSRFFTRDDNGYRIAKAVREVVVFAGHNLLRDPPFSRLDLIVCRNVFIYLQRDVQNDVIGMFHFALNPDGLLLLGPSETIERTALFHPESKDYRLYRRRNVPDREPRILAFPYLAKPRTLPRARLPRAESAASYGALHQKMVERYAPPSILVDQEFQVAHASEHAGRYLHMPGGEPTANVFKLVREELRIELRAALQAAAERNEDIRATPVRMQFDGKPRQVVLHVRRSPDPELEGLHLVIFDETAIGDLPADEAAPVGGSESSELELTKDRLRGVIAQYESSQEEMTAANEELQSTNEELRSIMEELETSREELQSMNEELQTVNQENRHKVEELSQLTSDLNNLMAATEIATLFLDRKLRILRVTPSVKKLFNVRASDRGRPLTDLRHHLGYDELQQDAESVLERLVLTERQVQSERGDWYLCRILPYRSQADRIEGVVITLTEITALKRAELALRESEERFRALVTASAQIVWMTDGAGNVREDSPSWRAFTGQSYDQWRSAGWIDAVHPDDRETALERWQACLESNTQLDTEFRLKHVSGEWRWTQVRAVPLRGDQGEVRGWVGMNIDITTRKISEENLRLADQRKDEFLAMLGHELRNPLAPMRTAMDLFKQLLPPDPRLQAVREMNERQVLHLSRLVGDLLDVSRIKSGRIELKMQRFDLRDIVARAIAGVTAVMEARHHQVTIDQAGQPLEIEGDEMRVGQIVTNLLDNAAKYSPEGGSVRITTRREDGYALISVADRGIGIPRDMLKQVFEVFNQGSHSRSLPASGLGLGLTLVQRLAELHGGSAEARSEGAGQGSEFLVRLPLATARSATRPRSTRQGNVAEEPESRRRRRVLVVDDNKDAADSLAMALETAGHEVRRAYDGRSAVEIAEDYRPEVAVLDIGLPDMDGYAVAQELRKREGSASAVLIALTGYGQDKDRAQSSAAGFDHHMVKPMDFRALDALLQDAEPRPRN